jgi:hypothetical protein
MSSLATGPRMMSNRTKSSSMPQHLTVIACISIFSILTITLLSGNGIGFATATKEVATNTFYVKITPEAANSHQNPNEVAHKIARRNGFHNLGPVRNISPVIFALTTILSQFLLFNNFLYK